MELKDRIDIYQQIELLFNQMCDEDLNLSMRLYGKKVMCFLPTGSKTRRRLYQGTLNGQSDFVDAILNKSTYTLPPNTIAFPENYLSPKERLRFVKNLIENKQIKDIKIITTDSFIASDFIQPLTVYIKVDPSLQVSMSKTDESALLSNIYTFYRNIMHIDSLSGKQATKIILNFIDLSNSKGLISKEEYDQCINDSYLIGDSFISKKIREQLASKYNNQSK